MSKSPKTIDPLNADFDDVVGALLGTDKPTADEPSPPDHRELIEQLTTPIGWEVSVEQVFDQDSKRLDAEHYDPVVMENDANLRALGVDLAPLTKFAEVRLPSMFTRIWAKDADHGLPYLNATDLMGYFALGLPAQERYLSYASNIKMEPLILEKGMILLTCSGTIGRVFDVPDTLVGSAGTHDIVRVIPHDPKTRGFLRAYLTTSLAQIQILSHTHGGQIDHVTAEQVGSCLVPELGGEAMARVSDLADRSDAMRADGLATMKKAVLRLKKALPNAE